MLNKPITELTDNELLDLLDSVSAEVKRRNSLSMAPDDANDAAALNRAANYFVDAIQTLTNR